MHAGLCGPPNVWVKYASGLNSSPIHMYACPVAAVGGPVVRGAAHLPVQHHSAAGRAAGLRGKCACDRARRCCSTACCRRAVNLAMHMHTFMQWHCSACPPAAAVGNAGSQPPQHGAGPELPDRPGAQGGCGRGRAPGDDREGGAQLLRLHTGTLAPCCWHAGASAVPVWFLLQLAEHDSAKQDIKKPSI